MSILGTLSKQLCQLIAGQALQQPQMALQCLCTRVSLFPPVRSGADSAALRTCSLMPLPYCTQPPERTRDNVFGNRPEVTRSKGSGRKTEEATHLPAERRLA
ncbi:hypothetical protein AAFF_G00337050 [Aldrovandia affinis]|uniref:Uncharacterized protein n=1 Tax=Aldrovandia affinis TaxID=143900 RepID=A0AAD7SL06_9TELE|nr:hypothetical protein AAFF_G00337050 [Aldrovandia affinis]